MTDEIECKVIQMDSGYNKLLTPPPGEENEKVPVTIDVTINSFSSFDISESKFKLQLVLGVKWFDARLKYNNLRPMKSSNMMGPMEKSSIWFPAVVFENTEEKLKSVVDEKAVIVVEKKGNGTAVEILSQRISYSMVVMRTLFTMNGWTMSNLTVSTNCTGILSTLKDALL